MSDAPSGIEKILDKLGKALSKDGDFPARAKVVTELIRLADDPNSTINQVSETIIKEPTLGTRVLHLVNSAFYASSEPIMTISHAVMRLGMTAISQLCSGLVLMQKFIPAAKQGEAFANNIKRSILTALLTARLMKSDTEKDADNYAEKGFLAGTFYNLGYLLLAYYFPQVFEAAVKRAKIKGHYVLQSTTELLGITRLQLNMSIFENLDVPEFYKEILLLCEKDLDEVIEEASEEDYDLVRSLKIGSALAEIIVDLDDHAQMIKDVKTLAKKYARTFEELSGIIEETPAMFEAHCKLIQLPSLELHPFLSTFSSFEENQAPVLEADGLFDRIVNQIKQANVDTSLNNILGDILETLCYEAGFDRAVYFENINNKLHGKISIGSSSVTPSELVYPVSKSGAGSNPCIAALLHSSVTTEGDPVFEDGWPFIAIPVGYDSRALGVIYADKIEGEIENDPLDNRQVSGMMLIAQAIDKYLQGNY